MKIQEYNDARDKITPGIIEVRRNLCEPLVPKFAKKYFEGDEEKALPIKMLVSGKLTPLLSVASGDLTDKVILDLGCGSVPPKFDDRIYEPWLCRALHEMGVHAIGVDIGNLDGEEFEHYSRDLSERNSLSILPDNSVDFAHAYLLFSSWRMGGRGVGKEPKKSLMPQLERILKPEGVFIYDM